MLTIHEIRKITGANPANLPPLYVHSLDTWRGDVALDSKGRLHMNGLQLAELHKNVPVREVGRIGPTTVEFAFNLSASALRGDERDHMAPRAAAKERQNIKRDLTGGYDA